MKRPYAFQQVEIKNDINIDYLRAEVFENQLPLTEEDIEILTLRNNWLPPVTRFIALEHLTDETPALKLILWIVSYRLGIPPNSLYGKSCKELANTLLSGCNLDILTVKPCGTISFNYWIEFQDIKPAEPKTVETYYRIDCQFTIDEILKISNGCLEYKDALVNYDLLSFYSDNLRHFIGDFEYVFKKIEGYEYKVIPTDLYEEVRLYNSDEILFCSIAILTYMERTAQYPKLPWRELILAENIASFKIKLSEDLVEIETTYYKEPK